MGLRGWHHVLIPTIPNIACDARAATVWEGVFRLRGSRVHGNLVRLKPPALTAGQFCNIMAMGICMAMIIPMAM